MRHGRTSTSSFSSRLLKILDPNSIPLSEPLVLQILHKNSLEPSKKLDFFNWCRSFKPNFKHSAVTYSRIFRTFCRSGFVEEVPNLLFLMKEDGVLVDSSTFKFLLDAFIWSGKFDTALEILDYMEESGACLNASVYDSVLMVSLLYDKLSDHGLISSCYRVIAIY